VKKRVALALSALLAAATVGTAVQAAPSSTPVSVYLNGELQTYSTPATIIDGRAFLPFREIFEDLQATVNWNEATRTVQAIKGRSTIELTIGKPELTLGDTTIKLDTAPQILHDRTMVPVRYIAEVLGSQVKWDADTRAIHICSNGCTQYDAAPAMQLDLTKDYTAVLHTDRGAITIQLFDNEAPTTVNNFVFLARDGFYDGIKFHRIIQDFMIQTGDPLGRGVGGPGYQFADELPPVKPYAPGIVAMANAGPNTNGSQFFIGTGKSVENLNKYPNYTVFGEVTAGLDVLQSIAAVPVGPSPQGEMSFPLEDVRIQSVLITEK